MRAKEQLIQSEIDAISTKLDKIPHPNDKRIEIQIQLQQQILNSYYRSPTRILDMDFDEKRKFLLEFFHGRKNKQPIYGIFITMNEEDIEHPFKFAMKGKFGEIRPAFYDHLPLDEDEMLYIIAGTNEISKKDRNKIILHLNLTSKD